jgi:hypothetical protein
MAKFLRLKETTQYKQTLQEKEKMKTNDRAVSLKFDISNSIYDGIAKLVKEHGVEDLYAKIDLTKAPSPVSFNFKVLSLDVKDFRSIESLHIDFSGNNVVTFLSGENGHGKSSVITALIVGLVGDRLIKRHNRIIDAAGNRAPCEVKVSLRYNGKTYFITRGNGVTKFAIDTEENYVSKSSKPELEAFIISELPFLQYLEWFVIKDGVHFFDAVDRTALIKTCFNLEIFDYVYTCADNMYNKIQADKDSIDEDLKVAKRVIESLEQSLKDTQLKVDKYAIKPKTVQEINTEMGNVTSVYNKAMQLYRDMDAKNKIYQSKTEKLSKIQAFNRTEAQQMLDLYKTSDELNNVYLTANGRYKGVVSSLESLNKDLNLLVDCSEICPYCNKMIKKDESYEQKKDDITNKITSYEGQKKELEDQLSMSKKACESFVASSQGTFIFMDGYGLTTTGIIKSASIYKGILADLDSLSNEIEEVQELNNDLGRMSVEYGNQVQELKRLTSQLSYADYIKMKQDEMAESATYYANLDSINSIIKSIKDNQSKIKEDEELEEMYTKDLDHCSFFRSIFDQANLDSIPYKVIKQVLDTINSDDVHFSSTKQLASGAERFKLSCSVRLYDDIFVDYDSASTGQKTILDLYILAKFIDLLNGIGLLVIDEGLSGLDDKKYIVAKEFFHNTMCNDLIVVAHNPNFDGADRELLCVLKNGVTELEER